MKISILLISLFFCLTLQAEKATYKARLEFRQANDKEMPGLIKKHIEGTKDVVYLHKKEKLNNTHILSAIVEEDNNTGGASILITFNDEGKKLFSKITQRLINKKLAILVDGKVLSAPTIMQAITEGKAQISGSFTLKEAKVLATKIKQKIK